MDCNFQKIAQPFGWAPNSIIFDKNISLKAKGLWLYMNSKPDGWHFAAERIAEECSDGAIAIRSGLKELFDAGLLEAKRQATGRFLYTLKMKPGAKTATEPSCQNVNKAKSQVGKKPSWQKAKLAKSQVGKKPTLIKTEINKERDINKKDLTTKVVKGASADLETYGNEKINEMMNEWERIFGFKQKNSQANRNACFNMLRAKDKGREWMIKTMQLMFASLSDRYAGKAVNGNSGFADMQQNYPKIWMWARAKHEEKNQTTEGIIGELNKMTPKEIVEYYERNIKNG